MHGSNAHYQQLLEAVAAVLKLDVTLISADLIRVAGTGPYRDRVGERVHHLSAAGQALASGQQIHIRNPRVDAVCQRCGALAYCQEAAYVATPVWDASGRPSGVLGLTAFGDGQRDQLLLGLADYSEFLAKISLLISSEMREEQTLTELLQAQGYLQTMANSVTEGLVGVDQEGKVHFLNGPARRMLRLSDERLPTRISDLPGLDALFRSVLTSGKAISDQELGVVTGAVTVRLVGNIQPIRVKDAIVGAVASLRDVGEVHQLVYHMSAGQPAYKFDRIIYQSATMQRVVEQAKRVAPGKSTVLIRGESGTGKELFARAIHAGSPRQGGPFIAVNCAAIPEELLESELFGYVEGAFTGARRGGKPGKFELADGGTIFLDEVGDMSLRLQAKLLRVIQEREVERVGSTKPIKLNVRIIAATNRDLEALVAQKEFREDLYFRLNVIPLEIPPVRQRRDDVPLLASHFCRRVAGEMDKQIEGFSQEAERLLLTYDWPGNVREIQNVIEYAVTMATGPVIGVEALPARIRESARPPQPAKVEAGLTDLVQVEKEALQRGLALYGTSDSAIRQIARELGLSRATVYRRIRKYNLRGTSPTQSETASQIETKA